MQSKWKKSWKTDFNGQDLTVTSSDWTSQTRSGEGSESAKATEPIEFEMILMRGTRRLTWQELGQPPGKVLL
jgi:hypothetical protein